MQQQSTLRSLQILHSAMLAGQLIFAGIAVFLKYNNIFPSSLVNNDNLLQVTALAVSFGGFFIGSSIFKRKIAEARDTATSMKEKAGVFRSASIIQWALLEAPVLVCIIFFLLVGNYAFIALAAALVLWFFLARPSKMKTMLLLRLSEEEMERF